MSDRSVLIIDDDQSLVAAVKEGLETLGFRVAAAYDALQGVLQAHQGKPDIIMLDFNMPAGGGSGVYDRLRASTDTAATPIVFLTGATVEEVKKTIRSTPNTFFLKKPISVSQLRKVLDKIIAARESGAAGKPTAQGASVAQSAPPPPPAAAPPQRNEFPGAPKTSPFVGMGTPGEASVPSAPSPTFDQPLGRVHDEAPAPSLGAPTPLPRLAESAPAPAPAPSAAGGGLDGKVFVFQAKVAYADTDRLGIVYHGNYLRYFETGRTELLRAFGIRYRDLEMERQLYLPVVECRCEYLVPCRYDDSIMIRCWISEIGASGLSFSYEILNADEGGQLAVKGFTRHALLNAYWKSEEIPEDLRAKLSTAQR